LDGNLFCPACKGDKMKMQDRQLLIAYRNRWRAVEAVEHEERRTASVAPRWQQTHAIFRLAMVIGLLPNTSDDQDQEVYRRWAALKGARLEN
jgi:hypothetical protein